MKSLRKTSRLQMRLTQEQRRKVERAAQLETRRRGEMIEASTLVRDIVMARVDEILAADTAARSAA